MPAVLRMLRTPLIALNSCGFILERILPILLKCYTLIQQHQIDMGVPLNQKDVQYIDKALDIPEKIQNLINDMQTFITDNLKAIKRSTSEEIQEDDLIPCISYKGIQNALDAYPFKDQEQSLIHWNRQYYFTFLGNPVLFLRILFNLLNNALYQINQKGRGEIFISSEQQEHYNVIHFKDTAGGVPLDILSHIFEGYKTTKAIGTGIGLAFCKLTMQSFGGDITCHSASGDSIEFLLSFPKILS